MRRLEGWQAACVWALAATVGLRLGLGFVMALAWQTAKPHLPIAELNHQEVYGELEITDSFPADVLLGVWPRWDAVHHLNLALRGYFDLSEGDSVFYPLYAILTRAVAGAVGDFILAGLIISTLATFLSFAGLYRLADTFYGPETARLALLSLAVFPTALFLVAPFTESLFLALTLGTFIAAYHQRWWLAGILGFLASLTRGPGMITVFSLAVIAYQQWHSARSVLTIRWGISVAAGLVLPVAGSLVFLLWRNAVGFASITETLRQYSGLRLADPVTGLIAGIQQWLRVRDLPTSLDLISAAIFITLTAVMIIRPKWRKPEWIIYVILNLILFLSKQSFIASSLQSLPRYVLMLFPIYIVIGSWLASTSRITRAVYLAISTSCLFVLSMLYALWVFIA